ncbi:MAG: cation:proton antiporter [Gammaproteobacteria bacterium]|nr:cation:proton antiporter [Gammaproteobacteria bacterium]
MAVVPGQMAWPLALAIAWLAGEAGHRWLALPRISSYGITGFLLAAGQLGVLPDARGGAMALVADLAFGLILFELGYRINLTWLKANRWLGVTSIVESGCSFLAVFVVARMLDAPLMPALLMSALAMSTSPAAVLWVVNEARSSGQVTERTLHLSAFNCILALVVFKVLVGYSVLASAGGIFQAVWNSLAVVLVSVSLGALFGVAVPGLLRRLGGLPRHATVAFALAVLLLTALTDALRFSPLLAALAFGLVARHRRVVLSQVQRNFGALGDLLTVVLFVFVGATLDWHQALAGLEIALAVMLARLLAKVGSTTLLARPGGITWRKGALTGLALTPLSAFAILVLEQTRHLELSLLEDMTSIIAMALLLEVAGPLLTRWALVWSGEAQRPEDD